jgi:hypothetical protein
MKLTLTFLAVAAMFAAGPALAEDATGHWKGSIAKIFPTDEVLYFESDTRYTRVAIATDAGLIRAPVKELQAGLDADQFWQIRRSTLVCARAVARVRRDALSNFTVELREHAAQHKVGPTWRFRSEGLMREGNAAIPCLRPAPAPGPDTQ